jgi:hypothetical protein
MGRRISTGVLPGGVGFLSFDTTNITTVKDNENLVLTADGTGIVDVQKDLTLTAGNLTVNAQGDVRFADSDSSNYVAIQGPATVGTNYTITLPSAVAGANGYALKSTTGGVTSWGPADPFAGTYSTQTTSFATAAFNCYFVNTSGGVVTATLPSSPAVGDTIRFLDVAKTFDTNSLTVARNGKLIQGDAADMTVSTESAAFDLIFSGDTFGWRIFSV